MNNFSDGPDLYFFGQAGQANPLDGRCCSSLVQTPYSFHTHTTHTTHTTQTTHTTATQTQSHVQHSPCSHRIGKAQTQSSHPLNPSPPTSPRSKHIHITHTPPTPLIPRTTLIPSTSAAPDTLPEPRVPPTCTALTTPTPHLFPTPAWPSPSDSLNIHASQSQQPSHPHRVPQQTHRQTNDNYMATDTIQGYRPSSKNERNLIITQVNINGIETNSRSSNGLFTTHLQTSSQFRKPSSPPPLKQTHLKCITSPPCVTI